MAGVAVALEPHPARQGAILAMLFAMIFKLMPATPIAWRDVGIGAAVTAALFKAGSC